MAARGRISKPYDRPGKARQSDGMWMHDKAPGAPRAMIAKGDGVGNGNGPVNPASVNSKLVVSNLHYNVTPKDLVSIFGQIGTLVREPHIKYDRSGRSTGVAFITYETPIEATRAKKQFDGILAKGQPMAVAYDTSIPRTVRRVSAPGSLINRIEKQPLIERLTTNENGNNAAVYNGHTANRSAGGGPIRNRGGRGRGTGASRASFRKTPKTAEELDKELDAFMGDDDTAPGGATTDVMTENGLDVAATADADVDMA